MAVEIKHIIKRDGSVKDFDVHKIVYAIECAGKATNQFGRERAQEITDTLVIPRLRELSVATPHIEQVQDAVEHALYEAGHFETLRAYIVYREQRARNRDAKKSWVDVESSINEYLNQSDWRVNANANQGYSLGGLILNVSGKVIANYWLNFVYTPEIGQCHRQADFHIHDLDMLSGYCAGWSLRTLLQEGFNGVPGKVEAGAPKHFSSATGQIVNFLGTMQNEWAGAQAFSSFDTYMAPFIRKDNTPYEEVLQGIQELIYNLNVPSRWGTQTPFTNLTFDWTCPEDLKNVHPLIGGEEMSFTYGELQKEMDMINRAYIEVMTKGDAKGRVFTFPIPTYNITPDFDWDSPNVLPLFDMTARYGLPYFQNFINSELKPNMIELDGGIQVVDLPKYMEGPWLHKRGDMYYLTYASMGDGNEAIAYATAPSVSGPWTYRGELTGMAENSFTIHPGIIEFKGRWYLFYHNATLTLDGRPGAIGRRSVCVDELFYNPDGTMKFVEQTKNGVSAE